VCRVLATVLAAVSTVWYLQHYQPMVITSLLVSLVPVAILSLQVTTLSPQVTVLSLQVTVLSIQVTVLSLQVILLSL
jgi:hypothetical protein